MRYERAAARPRVLGLFSFVLAISAITVMLANPRRGEAGVWVSHGPEGGFALAVAIDPVTPQTVYAGSFGAVFKSTDAGGSWQLASDGLRADLFVRALAIDPANPQIVYVGMDNGGAVPPEGAVFKSTDGGATWNGADANLDAAPVRALAVDPVSPATVYAGTNGGGVFKSPDGGQSWAPMNTNLTDLAIRTLAIDPGNHNVIYTGTAGGSVFKSTNGAGMWASMNMGLPGVNVQTLAIDRTNPQTVYAATFGAGVFKSTNGGASWVGKNVSLGNLTVIAFAIDPGSPGTLYAGTFGGGVFRTTSGGDLWADASTGLTTKDVRALAIDPASPATVYAGTNAGGVFKSANGAASWGAANTGMLGLGAEAIAADPVNSGTAYTGASAAGVFKTVDAGNTWQSTTRGVNASGFSAMVVDPTNPMVVYAGAIFGSVFKTTNGGIDWAPMNTGLTMPPPFDSFTADVRALVIDPSNTMILYASSDGSGVFKSEDGAAHWRHVNTGLTFLRVNALAIDPTHPATLYAGAFSNDLQSAAMFKTENGGEMWTAKSDGLTVPVSAVVIDPVRPNIVYAGTFSSGVFRTADSGATWGPFTAGLTSAGIFTLAIDPVNSDVVYAGTFKGGVFRTVDRGGNWAAFGDGLGTESVFDLDVDPHTRIPYAATNRGAFVLQPVCGDGTVDPQEDCDDGNTASGDCCAGNCRLEALGAPCLDEGNLCTNDKCDGAGACLHTVAPQPDCKAPVASQRASLVIKKASEEKNDALAWAWTKGAVTVKAEFGDPTAATNYAFCAYAGTAAHPSLAFRADAPAGGTCGHKPCWKATRTGFVYGDKDASPDGLRSIVLREGRKDGQTKIAVNGKGGHLDLPDLPLAPGTKLTVQLRNGAGVCWGAAYSTTVRNKPTLLRAKSD